MFSGNQRNQFLILNVISYLSKRRKLQIAIVLTIMVIGALAELVTLAAALPFLELISDPSSIIDKGYYRVIESLLQIEEPEEIRLPMTIIFCAASVVTAIIRLLILWASSKLAAAVGSELGRVCYKNILYQPYSIQVNGNSSKIISILTTQLGRTVSATNAMLQLCSSVIVATTILIGLLILDWRVALVSITTMGTAYLFIGRFTKNKLRENGSIVTLNTNKTVKLIQEGLGSIRDILVEQNQQIYIDGFAKSDRALRQGLARNQFLARFPRFSIEALAVILIAILGYYLSNDNLNGTSMLPILGTMALAAQKLLPALQQTYYYWASLAKYHADITNILEAVSMPTTKRLKTKDKKFRFQNNIKFENIWFKYDKEGEYILKDVNFEIHQGESVGIIGQSGCGKSTLIDILMGLLEPSKGSIWIDNIDISCGKNRAIDGWKRQIAHVPQDIFLIEGTYAENIAFGVPKNRIDYDKIRKVAREANILEFIESQSEGFNSNVGERGIKLSGGQRQRIGIARALYRNARVLILDEATSALDKITEKKVMKSIRNEAKDITLIIVAHKLSTLETCNKILRVRNQTVTVETKDITNA